MQFHIDSAFLTDIARSWFWNEKMPYKKSEELLMCCLNTDKLSIEEKKANTIDDAIAAFKKRCADSASSHAAMTWGTTETDKGIDAILEIIISVNGEYFDSEVSPAKIGTKEVQVLMDEVA